MPFELLADQLGQQAGLFEPQRQSSFAIELHLEGVGVYNPLTFQIALQSSNLPTMTIEEVELNLWNVKRYVAGKATYESIPLVCKDMVDVGIAHTLDAWQRQVYDPRTDQIGLARFYKKTANLIMFAANGYYIRNWTLIGCWPQSINHGALDMSSSEPVQIEATLRYDKAIPNLAVAGAPI